MYLAKWSWKNEWKVFLVDCHQRENAIKEAKGVVGQGGSLEIEEIDIDSFIFMIISSEDL